MAEQKSVERAEDQAFRSARSAGHHSNVTRLKAVLANMRKRSGASVNLKSFHPGKGNKARRLLRNLGPHRPAGRSGRPAYFFTQSA